MKERRPLRRLKPPLRAVPPYVFGMAQRVREEREERALTYKALSERTGVPASVLHMLEEGKTLRPYLHTVADLADFFQVPIDYLICRSNIIPYGQAKEVDEVLKQLFATYIEMPPSARKELLQYARHLLHETGTKSAA